MVDLLAVAAELERREPSSKLAAALKNAGRAQSCVADVRLARTTLEALAQLRGKGRWAPAVQLTAAEHALLANSVFLYARAVATGAKQGERGHTPIRAKLSAEDQRRHDRVINVRNTALAHVRANEKVSDDLWHREIVFAVEQPDGAWLPAAVSRRVQANRSLESDLRSLLPTAEDELRAIYFRRLTYATELLQKVPSLLQVLEKHLLDPIEVFDSESEAAKALSRHKAGGKMSGVIDH